MARTHGNPLSKTKQFGGVTVQLSTGSGRIKFTPPGGHKTLSGKERDRLVKWLWEWMTAYDNLHPTATEKTLRDRIFGGE
jgi:hypothetical protein